MLVVIVKQSTTGRIRVRVYVGHFPSDIIPPTVPNPGQFPSQPRTFPLLLKRMALIRTSDPNRSTSVNFVHVKESGRSLYIVDRQTVMVEG